MNQYISEFLKTAAHPLLEAIQANRPQMAPRLSEILGHPAAQRPVHPLIQAATQSRPPPISIESLKQHLPQMAQKQGQLKALRTYCLL